MPWLRGLQDGCARLQSQCVCAGFHSSLVHVLVKRLSTNQKIWALLTIKHCVISVVTEISQYELYNAVLHPSLGGSADNQPGRLISDTWVLPTSGQTHQSFHWVTSLGTDLPLAPLSVQTVKPAAGQFLPSKSSHGGGDSRCVHAHNEEAAPQGGLSVSQWVGFIYRDNSMFPLWEGLSLVRWSVVCFRTDKFVLNCFHILFFKFLPEWLYSLLH